MHCLVAMVLAGQFHLALATYLVVLIVSRAAAGKPAGAGVAPELQGEGA